MTTRIFFKVCLDVDVLIFSVQLLKKQTLDPEITLIYQFHGQKALFKVSKICSTNFWIGNSPSPFPLELFSKIIRFGTNIYPSLSSASSISDGIFLTKSLQNQKLFHTQATSDIRENPLVTVLGSHAAMTCQIVVGQKSKVKIVKSQIVILWWVKVKSSDCLKSVCQLMVGKKSVCRKKKSKEY